MIVENSHRLIGQPLSPCFQLISHYHVEQDNRRHWSQGFFCLHNKSYYQAPSRFWNSIPVKFSLQLWQLPRKFFFAFLWDIVTYFTLKARAQHRPHNQLLKNCFDYHELSDTLKSSVQGRTNQYSGEFLAQENDDRSRMVLSPDQNLHCLDSDSCALTTQPCHFTCLLQTMAWILT